MDEMILEEFCAAEAEAQKRAGVEVPSKARDTFSYCQWRKTARRRLAAAPHDTEAGGPQSKRVKVEMGEDALPAADNSLAEALALQLSTSLRRLSSDGKAPASQRHAAQEAFPMPHADEDMPAFLTLSEAALRLALWQPEDMFLYQLASRMRPNLRWFEDRGLIKYQTGCFPNLQVLMDLLSWRIICQRWARLPPYMRQVAVKCMQRLCVFVTCPSAGKLSGLLEKIDIRLPGPLENIAELDHAVADFSTSVPLEFANCRSLIPLLPDPDGEVCVSGLAQELDASPSPPEATAEAPPSKTVPAPSRAPAPAAAAAEAIAEPSSTEASQELPESDVRVGELIGATPVPIQVTEARVEPKKPTPMTDAQPRAAPPVVAATPPTAGDSARPSGHIERRRLPLFRVNGHPACISRYHQRYAPADKHASAECPYCAACHLMEIVFGGETRDCTWKHWPTQNKIRRNLKHFPAVLKLALERFSLMERGVRLAATDEVPL